MTTQNNEQPAPAGFLLAAAVAGVMAVVGVYYGWKIYQARSYDAAKAAEVGDTSTPPAPEAESWPLCLWGVFNAVLCGSLATWYWGRRQQTLALADAGGPRDRELQSPPNKLLLLGVGGILGFTTAVFLGLGYVYTWWGTLTGGRANWKDMTTSIPILLVLAGLFAMFISLLAVRSEERTNPTLRRLVYGYNTFLTALLVLAILGVGNVMAFFYGTHAFDWTEANIYSVSPASIRVLETLEKPVKVYVIISPLDPLYEDVKTLLTTSQSYTDKLEVEYVNSRHTLNELVTKYEIQDNTAMLVVYDPEESKPLTQMLREEDLEESSAMRMSEGRQRSFSGERALINAISILKDGTAKLTVYFTQNNGEMQLGEFSSMRERGVLSLMNRGLGSLRSKLEKSNYTVKDLQLGAIDEKTGQPSAIPDDAGVVVMADPKQVPEAHVKLLDEYLKRPKSKLVVLLDAHVDSRTGQTEPSGLEELLARYGVQVGRDIVLNIQPPSGDDPTEALIMVSPQSDPGFDAFRRNRAFQLFEVRSIRPAAQAAQPAGPYVVSALLETMPRTGQFAEESLRGTPSEFLTNLARNQRPEFLKKVQSPPVPVAVTVREQSKDSMMPQDQFHARARREGPPKLVVFGDATMISNPLIEGAREIYYNLFAGSLAWLRGRTDIVVDVQPKERKNYRMGMSKDQISRAKWLPFLVLTLGVIGIGVAVWFTRQKST